MEEIKQAAIDEGEKITQEIADKSLFRKPPRVRKGDRLNRSKGIHVGVLNKVREQPRKRR